MPKRFAITLTDTAKAREVSPLIQTVVIKLVIRRFQMSVMGILRQLTWEQTGLPIIGRQFVSDLDTPKYTSLESENFATI